MKTRRLFVASLALLSIAGAAFSGRAPLTAAPTTAPPAGLRETSPHVHALVGARVVVSPTRTMDKATLVVRDGVIVAVGENVTPPGDAQIWDVTGKNLYPGFIDAYAELSAEASRAGLSDRAGAGYWNGNIVPEVSAALHYAPDASLNRKLRGQGITTRLVAPSLGIIKGTSALVNTAEAPSKHAILKDGVALHLKLTVPRGISGYPNSPMGAYTLVRQAFYDAGWYGQAWATYQQDNNLPRPERSDALAVLRDYLGRKPLVIIDAGDELYFLRADRVAREFDLNAAIRGSGEEYKRLDAIAGTRRAVIVPLDFPKAPNVGSPEAAMNVELERLMHWDLAPENPARLADAGVKIAFTTQGLRDVGTFLSALRKAVDRGLKPEAALRALTTTPAELFGAADRLGTIESGKAANFVITDGELFAGKTKLLETWVDGERYEIQSEPVADVRGTWKVDIAKPDGGHESLSIELTGQPTSLKGKVTRGDKNTPALSAKLNDSQLVLSFKGKPLDLDGVIQLSATVSKDNAPSDAESKDAASKEASANDAKSTEAAAKKFAARSWLGVIAWADGQRSQCTGQRTEGPKAADDKPVEKPAVEKPADKPAAGETKEPAKTDTANNDKKPDAAQPADSAKSESPKAAASKRAISPINFPLGAFGRTAPPEQLRYVLLRNATVWTCGPQGLLEKADVLVDTGKIQAVGTSLAAPEGAVVIDATGKHISPGVIDCHSHSATDGGVNESGQTITAEVRVGDFIDPTDINIYRQLGGGVTAANILHGSANTIGGQNQVIKFRWGAGPEEMKLNAMPGIKFALGENVKQSNRTERAGTRYPQSRMGVEQLVRDSFRAAQQYRQQWDSWNRTKVGLPPRTDLELEALAEVVEGKRLIHCHSYRQDEILALLRTCESFNIRIGTFQHILEGYKVADVMARHGVGASSFSDWWAYKFEVFDAIPYNGALLHNAGVVVSFNSDNSELARRLNLEAAKAVKYGGVPPEEALKFVTLNPAKQLRIDGAVGSLEPGKDADLVVWSGPPLSTFSRCEQTWVDGRRYFDLEEDRQRQREATSLRAALVQRILGSDEPGDDGDGPKKDLWPREDTFCEHGDHDGHGH